MLKALGTGSGEIRIDVRQVENIDGATAQIAAALERDVEVEKYTVLQTKTLPAVMPDGETLNLTVELGDHSVFPVNYSAAKQRKSAAGRITLTGPGQVISALV